MPEPETYYELFLQERYPGIDLGSAFEKVNDQPGEDENNHYDNDIEAHLMTELSEEQRWQDEQ